MIILPPTAEELARWKATREKVAAEESATPPRESEDEDHRFYQWESGFAHSNGEWLA